jgi:hypothetical protein
MINYILLKKKNKFFFLFFEFFFILVRIFMKIEVSIRERQQLICVQRYIII